MSNKIIKMNNIPEGYEIDQKNSTIEKIVLVKKSIYPKDWEEHFIDNYIEGFILKENILNIVLLQVVDMKIKIYLKPKSKPRLV